MYYVKLTNKDVDIIGINLMYLELDQYGSSIREIGFDEQNNLKHIFPSDYYKNGTYGLFEFAPFGLENLDLDLSKDEFEKIWNKFKTSNW